VGLKPLGGGGKRLDGSLRFLTSGEKPRLEEAKAARARE